MDLMIQLTALKNEGDPVRPIATIVMYDVDNVDAEEHKFSLATDATCPLLFFYMVAGELLAQLAQQEKKETENGVKH